MRMISVRTEEGWHYEAINGRIKIYVKHCVKSVQSAWSVLSRIQTEYGYLRSKSLYSIRIREIRTGKNSVFIHFPRCEGVKNW